MRAWICVFLVVLLALSAHAEEKPPADYLTGKAKAAAEKLLGASHRDLEEWAKDFSKSGIDLSGLRPAQKKYIEAMASSVLGYKTSMASCIGLITIAEPDKVMKQKAHDWVEAGNVPFGEADATWVKIVGGAKRMEGTMAHTYYAAALMHKIGIYNMCFLVMKAEPEGGYSKEQRIAVLDAMLAIAGNLPDQNRKPVEDAIKEAKEDA